MFTRIFVPETSTPVIYKFTCLLSMFMRCSKNEGLIKIYGCFLSQIVFDNWVKETNPLGALSKVLKNPRTVISILGSSFKKKNFWTHKGRKNWLFIGWATKLALSCYAIHSSIRNDWTIYNRIATKRMYRIITHEKNGIPNYALLSISFFVRPWQMKKTT